MRQRSSLHESVWLRAGSLGFSSYPPDLHAWFQHFGLHFRGVGTQGETRLTLFSLREGSPSDAKGLCLRQGIHTHFYPQHKPAFDLSAKRAK